MFVESSGMGTCTLLFEPSSTGMGQTWLYLCSLVRVSWYHPFTFGVHRYKVRPFLGRSSLGLEIERTRTEQIHTEVSIPIIGHIYIHIRSENTSTKSKT